MFINSVQLFQITMSHKYKFKSKGENSYVTTLKEN